MKTIAFFIPFGLDTPGGAERALTVICNMLSKKGYKIFIITYRYLGSYYKLDCDGIISLDFIKSNNWLLRKLEPLVYLRKFRKIIMRVMPDTIITLGTEGVLFKMLALLFYPRKIKKIAWEHNSFFQPTYKMLKITRTCIYKYLDKVFVLNTDDYNVYKNILGPEKVCLVPNSMPWKTKKINYLKNKTIISVGRYEKVKGFELLIKAFGIIANKYPDWKLKIFGKDEGERDNLLELIETMGLKNQVELNSETNDIEKEYLNSSIYVMSSRYECFPMVLLEAKECGLPIVGFNCPSGPKDLINDNEDGYLIDCYDINDLALKIEKLIIDEPLRVNFGNQAKKNVKKYDIEIISTIWMSEI